MLLNGCLDIPLDDQFSDPDAITSTETARELLASAYSSLPRYQMEFSILSDDFVPTNLTPKYAELQNLYNWQEKAIDDLSDNVWNGYYMTVAIVNALLPRLDNVVLKDDADKTEVEKIRGEADYRIIAVEPESCPSLTRGKYAYDFGDTGKMTPLLKMYTLGSGFMPAPNHSGGLRYHGMNPIVSKLYHDGYKGTLTWHRDFSSGYVIKLKIINNK